MAQRAATWYVVRLNRADDANGVATVDANDHRNAEDVYFVPTVVGNLDRVHVFKWDCVVVGNLYL